MGDSAFVVVTVDVTVRTGVGVRAVVTAEYEVTNVPIVVETAINTADRQP